jgi:hypothetical protein
MTEPKFTNEARALLEATGSDWQTDLGKLKFEVMTRDEMLAPCIEGADPDDVPTWEDYVETLAVMAERTQAADIASDWIWEAFSGKEIGDGIFSGTPRELERHVRDVLLEGDYGDGSFLVWVKATALGGKREWEFHVLFRDLGDEWRARVNPDAAQLREAGLNESGLPL